MQNHVQYLRDGTTSVTASVETDDELNVAREDGAIELHAVGRKVIGVEHHDEIVLRLPIDEASLDWLTEAKAHLQRELRRRQVMQADAIARSVAADIEAGEVPIG